MKKLLTILIVIIVILIAGVIAVVLLFAPARTEIFSSVTEVNMNLTSTAFTQGQPIPTKFSCKGADLSPALAWDEPPAGTQSFALLMDDPDAPMGTWDHWVLFNIPAATRSLAENFQPAAPIIAGKNSWGKNSYGGPCPPSGTHRYFFRLYALDTTLSLASKAAKADVLSAMQGHMLGMGELMGTFSK